MAYQINIKKMGLPIENEYLSFLHKIIRTENPEAIVSSFNKNLFDQYIQSLINSKNISLYICELDRKSVGYVILTEKPSYLVSNFKKMRISILVNLILNFKIKALINLFLIFFKIDLILLPLKKRKIINEGHNINLLAIDSEYQSKGIGSNFMTEVFKSLAKTSKLSHISVETNNIKTGKFYEEKLGFIYVGKKIRYFKSQKIYIKYFI